MAIEKNGVSLSTKHGDGEADEGHHHHHPVRSTTSAYISLIIQVVFVLVGIFLVIKYL